MGSHVMSQEVEPSGEVHSSFSVCQRESQSKELSTYTQPTSHYASIQKRAIKQLLEIDQVGAGISMMKSTSPTLSRVQNLPCSCGRLYTRVDAFTLLCSTTHPISLVSMTRGT
jgi:hypothetical protein